MRAVAALLALACATVPAASAQAPSVQDAVLLACDAVRYASPGTEEVLPICPAEEAEFVAPREAQGGVEPAQDEAVASAHEFAESIVHDAKGVARDPATAPTFLESVAAKLRSFVDGLVSGAAAGADAVRGHASAVADDVASAAQAAAGAVESALESAAQGASSAARAVAHAVRGLWPGGEDASPDAAPREGEFGREIPQLPLGRGLVERITPL